MANISSNILAIFRYYFKLNLKATEDRHESISACTTGKSFQYLKDVDLSLKISLEVDGDQLLIVIL